MMRSGRCALVAYFTLLWGSYSGLCQFPRRCTTESSLRERECCPDISDEYGKASKCGKNSKRGECVEIIFPKYQFDAKLTIELIFDDRKDWPRAFYDKACRCNGNFDGIDCGQCQPGYFGTKCDKKKKIGIRRNINSFSDQEREKLILNLDVSKFKISEEYVILTTSYDRILAGEKPVFENISMYDLFVWMHYYSSRDNLMLDLNEIGGNSKAFTDILLNSNISDAKLQIYSERDYAHSGPAFLPWHRYFLLKWEIEFAKNIVKDPYFSLPYWDWRDSDTCDLCTNSLFGGKNSSVPQFIDDASPFSSWQSICSKNGDEDYLWTGKQCDGRPEGQLLRNYGEYDRELSSGIPSSRNVESSLRMRNYENPPYDASANGSFRNIIEGYADPTNGTALTGYSTMHNAVHLFMNGTMSEVGSSANDPLFIVHHAFVDGIYEQWIRRHSLETILSSLKDRVSAIPVGHNLQDYMVPFFPLVKQIDGFRPSEELGYTYDFIEDELGSGLMNLDMVEADISSNDFESPKLNSPAEDLIEGNLVEAHFEPLIGQPQSGDQKRAQIDGITPRGHHWKLKHRGETFATSHSNSEVKPVGDVDVGSEIHSGWDRLLSDIFDGKLHFSTLKIRDQIVFLFMLGATTVCIVVCILICCRCRRSCLLSRSSVTSKGSKGERRLCCGCGSMNSYDDGESQALLKTRKAPNEQCCNSVKEMKMINGKIPFDEI